MKRPHNIEPDRIGFDLDGVIANTAEAFLRIACQQYGYCSFTLEDITNFEIDDCVGIPAQLVEKIFTEIMEDSLKTGLQPMPGAVEVLGELAGRAPITVITARPLQQPVLDWFNHFFPKRTSQAIRLIATGDHDDKLRHITTCNLHYFIDDRAETCEMLAAADLSPLVYSHPWNRDRHSLPAVENWQEIRALLALDQQGWTRLP
ncbi:MAG: 5' nucleotidase, NT5C type [Desulfopila sp.]